MKAIRFFFLCGIFTSEQKRKLQHDDDSDEHGDDDDDYIERLCLAYVVRF